MIWYRKVIANGPSDYLRSLGVRPEVIQFIMGTPEQLRQLMINEARKNPQISVQQLSQLQQPKKIDPYTQTERTVSRFVTTDERLGRWLLVELKKHRKNPMQGAADGTGWTRWYNLAFLATCRQNRHAADETAFVLEMREVVDWAARTGAQIESFNFETAVVNSDEWHNASGDATVYQEKNIVYGPKWSGKDFEGWTIQEVRTENDLECEGNLMDHCVGDYFRDVQSGKIKIYSLRDPHNAPHVTMEVSGTMAHQIRGKSNHEPKPLYKQMIAEWVKNDPNAPKESDDEGDFYNNDGGDDLVTELKYTNNREIDGLLDRFGQDLDDYGLRSARGLPDVTMVYDTIINEFTNKNRDDHYYGWMKSAAASFVRLFYLFPDVKEREYLRKLLEKKEAEYFDHLNDYSAEGVDGSYPSEEDYDDPKEYEKALEIFQQKEQEWVDYHYENTLPYAFIHDCWKTFNELEAERKKEELATKPTQ